MSGVADFRAKGQIPGLSRDIDGIETGQFRKTVSPVYDRAVAGIQTAMEPGEPSYCPVPK